MKQIKNTQQSSHSSVMLSEAVAALNIRPGYSYIDGTVGYGGHAEEIANQMMSVSGRSKPGRLILIDKDKEGLDASTKRLNVCTFCDFHRGSFSGMDQYVSGKEGPIGGVLLDLGISSPQVDTAARGFSFSKPGPLDMRMNQAGITAAEIVNESDERTLTDILQKYGEERFARRISERIVKERVSRPIITTTQLADVISAAVPKKFHGKTHPATKSFQALRIVVNSELSELEIGLQSALHVLAPTGRVAVITFHSLEDRIVKNFFKDCANECICPPLQPVCICGAKSKLKILTKKPMRPSATEIASNPRARSAKLRIAEKR